MLKLLDRTIASLDRRLVLLAPTDNVPAFFNNVEFDRGKHRHYVRALQKLRGRVYVNDGAVAPGQLTTDGLHETAEDEKSWHLLMVDSRRNVTGCAWYLQHASTVEVDDLRVRYSPLARMTKWRGMLWKGVESELVRARAEQLNYAEVGGWAVAEGSRCTSEGLVLALAGYSLGRICGGALGITTATVRHCSSTILRRLGGSPLDAGGVEVPSYYDPKYDCEMEILRFDSRRPSARYNDLIERLRARMADVPVFARPASSAFETEPNYRPLTALAS